MMFQCFGARTDQRAAAGSDGGQLGCRARLSRRTLRGVARTSRRGKADVWGSVAIHTIRVLQLYLFLAKVWIHCLFLAKIGVLYFYLLLAKIGALYLFLARTCLADGAAQAVYQPLYRWNSIINCVLTRFFDVYLASAGMTITFLKGTGCGFCVKGIELWAQVVILILLGPPQKMVGVPRSCHCNCQCQ